MPLNLGQYLAKVVLHVREALPHRPRYVLGQKKKPWFFCECQNNCCIVSIDKILQFYTKVPWPRLGQNTFYGTMVAKIKIFDAWLARKKFFIIRNIFLAKIEV